MSEQQSIDNKTLEYLREISIQLQKDPSARGRLMRVLAGDPSSDVARMLKVRQHNMPYYKQHFATELKFVLDRMLESKKTQEFRFVDFPRLSKHSLYLKVYQSFLWLIDHADADGTYIKLRNDTQIVKVNTGVRIRFVNQDLMPLNKAEEVDDAAPPIPEWRVKVDFFIVNGGVGEKLIIDKLKLSDAQVEELRESLVDVPGILHKVEQHRILLVKPRPEDLAAIGGGQ